MHICIYTFELVNTHTRMHSLPKSLTVNAITLDLFLAIFVEGRCIATGIPVAWQKEKENHYMLTSTSMFSL